MIRISKLDKYYNKGKASETHVIDNTTLEFGNTGLICILGESGSGKTTLINTMGGLDNFQSGSITYEDTMLYKNSDKEMEKLRNAKFGYIFQDQYLLSDYTAEYNIRLALNMYDISEQEKEARIDYVLQSVDMKKYKKRLISQLSGGQKQRIAIARALVKSPEIIFADEPTSNLDETNMMRIMGILKKISKDCLVILVTHNKRIADFFADRIIYINDGKITKDTCHKGRKIYRYNDDTNFYLNEFEKETLQKNNIKINLYSNQKQVDEIASSNRDPDPMTDISISSRITLNMIYKDGKLYIQTPQEEDVVFLTSQDETQIIEGSRPELDLNHAQDFEFSLRPIHKFKRPKLSFVETWNLANENVRRFGKKQFFLVISLIITSILLVAAAVDYLTALSVDKKDIITVDSHYIDICGKRNLTEGNSQYYKEFNKIYDGFVNSNLTDNIYISLDTALSFTYDGYGQTKQLSYSLSDFSYVTMDNFKKKSLILGRMPKRRNEIIIDKWLIDKFEDSDSVLKTLMPKMNSFLNLKVISDVSNQELTIVGICGLHEPTVYIDKYAGISLASWADKLASLQQLQKEYPGKYDNIKLASDEVLVSDSVDTDMKNYGKGLYSTKGGKCYRVVGSFPNQFGASYVIDDKYYKNILNLYVCNSRRFMIYTEDKDYFMTFFKDNLGSYNTKIVKLIATDPYTEQLSKFNEDREAQINTRTVITMLTFLLSLMMLYFTMKSNVMKIAQELSVYRLVGISKRSILSAFILEVIIITSYTVLPVVVILSSAIKFIIAMPSLQLDIEYPWYAVGAILIFMYLVNIIVGVIPVYNIIKRPPAQMAERA